MWMDEAFDEYDSGVLVEICVGKGCVTGVIGSRNREGRLSLNLSCPGFRAPALISAALSPIKLFLLLP